MVVSSVPTAGISKVSDVDFSFAKTFKSTIKLIGTASTNTDGSLAVFVSPTMVSLLQLFLFMRWLLYSSLLWLQDKNSYMFLSASLLPSSLTPLLSISVSLPSPHSTPPSLPLSLLPIRCHSHLPSLQRKVQAMSLSWHPLIWGHPHSADQVSSQRAPFCPSAYCSLFSLRSLALYNTCYFTINLIQSSDYLINLL